MFKSAFFYSVAFCVISVSTSLHGQNPWLDTLHHSNIEAGWGLSNSGYTPLWLRSLQSGAVPYESPSSILKVYAGKNYFVPSKRFHRPKTVDWRYELEAVAWLGKENALRLVQAYVAGKRKKWEIWVGRKKEIIGLGDSTLSSGFYAMSANALPPFKYRIGTSDYMDLWKGNIGLFMSYSDGLQDNGGPTKNAYIHQKALYGRIGKRSARLNLFAGINHNVSWGGERNVKTGGEYDVYPSNWSTYFYVVTALKDRTLVELDPNTSSDDSGNQYGNHLGSIDLAFQLKTDIGTFLTYKQTAYETGRITSLATVNDGISGISWKNPSLLWLNHLVLEYIYTANQGNFRSGIGEFFQIKDSQLSQIENYYNNNRGGWHYQGKGLGNPLIPIDRESRINEGYSFTYNAVKIYYLALAGAFPNGWMYQMRGSIGHYAKPRNHLFPRINTDEMLPQTTFAFSLKGKYSNQLLWRTQIAWDQGDIWHNSLGGMLTLNYIIY